MSYDTLKLMVFCGVVATAAGDVIAALMSMTGLSKSKWGLVGRWIAGIPKGQFINTALNKTPAVKGEELLGWGFHYFTGIVYGVLYIAYCESTGTTPDFINALCFGVVTVIAPYFILKPGMGAGVLARKTANPIKSCLLSLIVHTAFGVGLWVGILVFAKL